MSRITMLRLASVSLSFVVVATGRLAANPDYGLEYGFTEVPVRVIGVPGGTVDVEVFATLQILADPVQSVDSGLGGGLMSIAVEGAEVVSIDIDGLMVPGRNGVEVLMSEIPWIRMQGLARHSEDPERRGAVTLWASPGYPGVHEMYPFEPTPVLRIRLRAEVPEDGSCRSVRLTYEDGLQGSGEPVSNVYSYLGESCRPSSMQERGFCVTSTQAPFRRSDANEDGRTDVSDAIFTLNYLFFDSVDTRCEPALDANDDGQLNVTDAVVVFNFLFRGGSRPPAPFGECGVDTTLDGLICFEPGAC